MPRRLAWIFTSVLIGMLAPALSATPVAASVCPPAGTLAGGVDVSSFQGTINWPQVATSGVTFAYARVTDGFRIDSNAAANLAGARAAGIHTGGYAFAEPSLDPVQTADFFLANADLRVGDLLPVLDVEVTGGQSAPALALWIQAWLDRIQSQTGIRAVIYTAPGFWNPNVGSSAFGSYPLWVANWGVSCPSVPTGWSGWALWQYADNGSVPGISFNVGLDRLPGTNFGPVTITGLPRAIFAPNPGVTAIEGHEFDAAQLGTFTPGSGAALSAGRYLATVAWGDGTSSDAETKPRDGTVGLGGHHTYAADGSYRVTIALADSTGPVGYGILSLTVNEALLTATGRDRASGLNFDGRVAAFRDDNRLAQASDFHAFVDWGDVPIDPKGTKTSPGTITGERGHFAIAGSHTYASSGRYTVTTEIYDDDGLVARTTSVVSVKTD